MSMQSDGAKPPARAAKRLSERLQLLTPAQVLQIDSMLRAVGDYGEVRLIVQRGQLRYINKIESHKATDEGPPPTD